MPTRAIGTSIHRTSHSYSQSSPRLGWCAIGDPIHLYFGSTGGISMRDRYRRGWTVLLAGAMAALVSVAFMDARGFCLDAKPCNAARPSSSGGALQALLDGNTRWASGKPAQIGSSLARRTCLAKEGQTPYAAILSCSDSRVPPELI